MEQEKKILAKLSPEINKGLEVYVHIPFCKAKCSYCDFLSGPDKIDQKDKYIRSLKEEIKEGASAFTSKALVSSVFFGGGTPSLLSSRDLISLIEEIKREFLLEDSAEITVECNPGTLNKDKLLRLKEAGINRLSFGLQSALDEELSLLERVHSFEDFVRSYTEAREVGFKNINIDLIQALPGHTWDKFKYTLDKVLTLEPEHLSIYSLIIEEGTKLFDNLSLYPPLPNEEEERDIYHRSCEYLKQKDYEQYEISNFAKRNEGKEEVFYCKHNMGYWQRKPYLSFGIGAASLIRTEKADIRFNNSSSFETYINRARLEEIRENIEVLTKEEEMAEFVFLALRTIKGIDIDLFKENFDIDFEERYSKVIKKNIEDGLLEKKNKFYSLTKRGLDISNYVMSDFVD